jgi:spore coat polysaccharide biosynthesis predicted glycosyltransferase SpsG
MRTVICIEASHQRGLGHLFRGLHLAKALRAAGDEILFAVNDDRRSLEILHSEGFDVEVVASYASGSDWEEGILRKHRPDWWINDRLDTAAAHAEKILGSAVMLATFDDHGHGGLSAAFNVLAMDLKPSERMPNGLYGTEYIILDPEIEKCRAALPVCGNPSEILVTLGGSDTYGMTPRVLSALGGMQIPPAAGVSVGPNFNHREALNSALAKYPGRVRIYDNPSSLVGLIAKAEIIICGGGVTLFEAAALGVPALAIANEPHEIPIVRWFEEKGFCICLGFRENGVESRLSSALPNLLSGSDHLEQMSRTGRSLVDGRGLERIVARIRSERHE